VGAGKARKKGGEVRLLETGQLESGGVGRDILFNGTTGKKGKAKMGEVKTWKSRGGWKWQKLSGLVEEGGGSGFFWKKIGKTGEQEKGGFSGRGGKKINKNQ